MVFSNLIKLNSVVDDGFLMNKVISLYERSNRLLNTESDKNILKTALKYIQLIKDFKDFIEGKIIEDLQESAETYTLSFKGLKSELDSFDIEIFNKYFQISENQIKSSLENEKIIENNREMVLKLFKAIRKQLVKKSKRIRI